LVSAGLGVVLLVAAATTAILVASSGTKTKAVSHSNVPHGTLATSYQATYQEIASSPPVLRSAPARSDPATRKVVVATLTLTCIQTCTTGRYTGFGGSYALTSRGSQLSGASHSTCGDDSLQLNSGGRLGSDGQPAQSISGVLTRISTCPGTEVASPVRLELTRR
jgi:hypothetical protein